MDEQEKKQTVTWHTAFYDAIQLELFPYRDVLSFEFEHPLNAEPLRIDVVIVRKRKEAVIGNPVGAVFREANLIEYKSPVDYLSIEDFHKVGAYARLYAVLSHVEITDMTISFVTGEHPRKLLDYLRDVLRYGIQEKWPGIYYVSGDILPVQIIENRRLTGEEDIWLRDLTGGLDGEHLGRLLEQSRKLPAEAPSSAYMYMILQANSEGLREVMQMSDAALEAVFEEYGLTKKWEARGIEQGEENAKLLIARNLVNMGWKIEDVAKTTELDISKIRLLYSRNIFP
jgi:hypothetical protein